MWGRFKVRLIFVFFCWLSLAAFVMPRSPRQMESIASYLERVDRFYYRNVVPKGKEFLILGSEEIAERIQKQEYSELVDLQLERAHQLCQYYGLKETIRQEVKFEGSPQFPFGAVFVLRDRHLMPLESHSVVREKENLPSESINSADRINKLLLEMDYDNTYRGSYGGTYPNIVLTSLYCASDDLGQIPL